MKLTLTLELDEDALGDDLRYPIVAALLRAHADDIERTQGGAQMYATRIAYGPHQIVVAMPNHDHVRPEETARVRSEDLRPSEGWEHAP
jgi:hypothetical protein